MTINQPDSIQPVPGGGFPRRVSTPEEAAEQFEAILIRQFVAVMTKGLFKDSLAGEDGPGWIKGQQNTQRDVLTDVLTQHMVKSRALRISDMLLRQWRGHPDADASSTQEQEPS